MNKLTENWIVIVATVIITLIGNIAFSQWQINRNKVENAASVPYVDEKSNHLQMQIDNKVSRDELQLIMKQLNTIETNQTAIYQVLIRETNK